MVQTQSLIPNGFNTDHSAQKNAGQKDHTILVTLARVKRRHLHVARQCSLNLGHTKLTIKDLAAMKPTVLLLLLGCVSDKKLEHTKRTKGGCQPSCAFCACVSVNICLYQKVSIVYV